MDNKVKDNIITGFIVALVALSVYTVSLLFPTITIAYVALIILGILTLVMTRRNTRGWILFGMFIVLLIGASTAGVLIIDSMLKGIELVSGVQTGTFLFLPSQYGLFNAKDGLLAIICFILTVVALTMLSIKRRSLIEE